MQIVIDIPEEVYERCRKFELHCSEAEVLEGAVAQGTPLLKGHGRLIDADTYRKEMLDSREFDFFKRLDMQSTIIEADNAESEDKRCSNCKYGLLDKNNENRKCNYCIEDVLRTLKEGR